MSEQTKKRPGILNASPCHYLTPTLKDGRIECSTFTATDEFAKGALSSPDLEGILCEFSLTDVVEGTIDNFKYEDGTVSEQERSLFEALRAELVSMVDMIDRIRYESDGQPLKSTPEIQSTITCAT